MGRFLHALSLEGNVRHAAQAAGVSAQTVYIRRRRDAVFAALWDAALLNAREQAEQVLADRALNGVTETIWFRGEAVGQRQRFDTRLLLAHLGRLDARAAQASEEVHACAANLDDALDALLQGRDIASASGLSDPLRDDALTAEAERVESEYLAAHPEPAYGSDDSAWDVWEAGLEALREAALTATAKQWDEACSLRDARLDAALGLDEAPMEYKSADGAAGQSPLDNVNCVNPDAKARPSPPSSLREGKAAEAIQSVLRTAPDRFTPLREARNDEPSGDEVSGCADQRPCCASSRNRSAFSLIKPAASFWSYAPASSSNVTWRSEYRLSGDWRPTTEAMPLYSFNRTVPLTRAWLWSIAACSISRSGANQKPL